MLVIGAAEDVTTEVGEIVSIVICMKTDCWFSNESVAVAVIVWRPSERSEEVIDQIPNSSTRTVPRDNTSAKTSTVSPVLPVPKNSGVLLFSTSPFMWELIVTVIEVSNVTSCVLDAILSFPAESCTIPDGIVTEIIPSAVGVTVNV